MAYASYLQRREGRYSVQIRFSPTVSMLVGKPVYRASLRTSCYREAKVRLVEVLSWFHRMNDSVDYPSLFAKNLRTLQDYLRDEWPVAPERLIARQQYEELLKNFRRRAEAAGFIPAAVNPAFHQLFAQFVRQNAEAEEWARRNERDEAYERGRSEGREAARASLSPSSFGSGWSTALDPATAQIGPSDRLSVLPHVPNKEHAAVEEKSAEPISLSKAVELYVAARGEAGDKKDGLELVRLVVQFLIDVLGDLDTSDISASQLTRIDLMLPDIPNRTKLPVDATQSLYTRYQYAHTHGWKGLVRLTETRLRQYHNALSKFFGWLIKEGYFQGEKPVFKALSEENLVPLERDAFNEAEITQIIKQPLSPDVPPRHGSGRPAMSSFRAIFIGATSCCC